MVDGEEAVEMVQQIHKRKRSADDADDDEHQLSCDPDYSTCAHAAIDGVSLQVLENFRSARLLKMEGLCVCRDKPCFMRVSIPPETMPQIASYYFQWVVCFSEPAHSDPEMETVAPILVDEWKPETNGFSVRLKEFTIPACTRESVSHFKRAYNLHGIRHSKLCTKIRVTLSFQPVVGEPLATQAAPIVATSERLYVCSDRHMRSKIIDVPAPAAPSTSQTSVLSTSRSKKPITRGTGNESSAAEDSFSLPEAQRVKAKSDREYSDQQQHQRQLLHAELKTVAQWRFEVVLRRARLRRVPQRGPEGPPRCEVSVMDSGSPPGASAARD
jgi:hypothetical protein